MLGLLGSESLALLWWMENVGLSGQRLMDLLLLHVTVKVSAFNGTMQFYHAINQTLKPNMTNQGTWGVFIMRKSAWRCVWCFGRVSTSPLGGLLYFLSADDWWILTGFVFGCCWLVGQWFLALGMCGAEVSEWKKLWRFLLTLELIHADDSWNDISDWTWA